MVQQDRSDPGSESAKESVTNQYNVRKSNREKDHLSCITRKYSNGQSRYIDACTTLVIVINVDHTIQEPIPSVFPLHQIISSEIIPLCSNLGIVDELCEVQ